MKVKTLKVRHPSYDAELNLKYQLLYEGGDAFLKNVTSFLPRRNAEAMKLYNERVVRAFYIGYVGAIVDYFLSCLFAFNANINQKETKEDFYDDFMKNCDLKDTEFNQFFREVFTKVLIHKKSFILIDFPRIPEGEAPPRNLAEEKERGLDRAYLVHFTNDQLIDWQKDGFGNFEWVKFASCERVKASFDAVEVKRHRWFIYDKQGFQVFKYDEKEGSAKEDIDIQDAELEASGTHGLRGQVPILCVEVPDGLWVMNKLASLQIELFNIDNAMSWKENQSHYSMPVITLNEGKKEFKQKMGESYCIVLESGEKFEWSEPEGKMVESSLKRREMLKDEAFRIVHQMSLSVKQTKTQTRQSGNSKQEDRYATEVVLRAFGDTIRDSMQTILTWISVMRKDKLTWDVSGFSTFDTESTTEKLAQILQLRAIKIHSETFSKEVEKKAADFYLEDSNKETKDKIKKEIEAFDHSKLLEDPLDMVMKQPGKAMVPGTSKPSQQGEKPNGTNQPKKKL